MKITEFLKQYANNMYDHEDGLYMFFEDNIDCQYCPFCQQCCNKHNFVGSSFRCIDMFIELLEG